LEAPVKFGRGIIRVFLEKEMVSALIESNESPLKIVDHAVLVPSRVYSTALQTIHFESVDAVQSAEDRVRSDESGYYTHIYFPLHSA
jgi:hypothetical protein